MKGRNNFELESLHQGSIVNDCRVTGSFTVRGAASIVVRDFINYFIRDMVDTFIKVIGKMFNSFFERNSFEISANGRVPDITGTISDNAELFVVASGERIHTGVTQEPPDGTGIRDDRKNTEVVNEQLITYRQGIVTEKGGEGFGDTSNFTTGTEHMFMKGKAFVNDNPQGIWHRPTRG